MSCYAYLSGAVSLLFPSPFSSPAVKRPIKVDLAVWQCTELLLATIWQLLRFRLFALACWIELETASKESRLLTRRIEGFEVPSSEEH